MTPTNPGPWLIPGLSSRMVELHAQKGAKELTMGEIASHLEHEFNVEITRNAVIGRCRRLGLPARPSPLPPVKTARVKAARVRIDAPIVPREALVKEQGNSLTIYQLDNDTCKFVLGAVEDYPPYLFCGQPTKREGVSYCAAHYSRCHIKARVEWT
jgi:hypothetical protein